MFHIYNIIIKLLYILYSMKEVKVLVTKLCPSLC